YIVNLNFHMVSLATIIPSLDPGDWYAALDMKDAYFHISITPAHRRFLHFVIRKTHYQFTGLPFGLCTAPRVFTKCMAVVAAFLCRHHVHVFPYLDDWLVHGRSRQQVQADIEMITDTFYHLGIIINASKLVLAPTQSIEFIGAILDATRTRALLPEARRLALVDLIINLHLFPTTTARQCLKLLGHMAFCTYVVQHARLRLRPLQAWLASVYR
ncbi:ORF I polyprotein, partial [Chelydra serpentina]